MEYTLLVIIFAILLVDYMKHRDQQQTIDKLTDKVMSKDLKEYKEQTQGVQVYEPVTVNEQEEYYREIEEQKQ